MIIPITFTLNDNYIRQVEVALLSLFLNAKETTSYHVYLLNKRLAKQNRKRLYDLFQAHHSRGQLSFLQVPDYFWKQLPAVKRFPQEACARLLLPDLLQTYDKILHLDADVLVLDDLEDLFRIDITDKAFAAYPEGIFFNQTGFASTRLDLIDLYKFFKTDFDIDLTKRHYCNSGVMLMNLKFFRDNNFVNESLHFFDKYKNITSYPDQDALNILAMKKGSQTIHELHFVWNFMVTYLQNSMVPSSIRYNNAIDIRNLEYLRIYTQDTSATFESYPPRIIHYAAAGPWTRDGKNALYFEKYKYYASLCNWSLNTKRTLLWYVRKILKGITPYGFLCLFKKYKSH